jgi:hypothetical protein
MRDRYSAAVNRPRDILHPGSRPMQVRDQHIATLERANPEMQSLQSELAYYLDS